MGMEWKGKLRENWREFGNEAMMSSQGEKPRCEVIVILLLGLAQDLHGEGPLILNPCPVGT